MHQHFRTTDEQRIRLLKILFLILLALAIAVVVRAQQSRTQPSPSPVNAIQPTPQPAQQITIDLTAEAATALEGMRLNTRQQVGPDASGTTSLVPIYANIHDLVDAMLKSETGIVGSMLRMFPPDRIKTAAAARDKAQADYDAAVKSIASGTAAPPATPAPAGSPAAPPK